MSLHDADPATKRAFGVIVEQLTAEPPVLHAPAVQETSADVLPQAQLETESEELLGRGADDDAGENDARGGRGEREGHVRRDDDVLLGVFYSPCPGHSLSLTPDPCGASCCSLVVLSRPSALTLHCTSTAPPWLTRGCALVGGDGFCATQAQPSPSLAHA